MVDPFSNIDSAFKNAFEYWEAPHSPAEMNAGWNQVANHLPQAPGAHAPSPGNVAGHFAASIGKIIGFAGLGAAVVATAAVLYNIYVKPVPAENPISHPKTEQAKTGPVPQNNNSVSLGYNPGKAVEKAVKGNHSAVQGLPGNHSQTLASNPLSPTAFSENETPQKQNTVSNNATGAIVPKPQGFTKQAPSMKLFLSDTLVCANIPVTASSNISISGVVIEWGDGSWDYFNGKNVHNYTRSGFFKAHLTIDSTTAYRSITVLASPTARFTVHQGENLNFAFDNSSVHANSYVWDFGDGSPQESGYYSSHTYPDTGIYKARLVAINSKGCTDTAYQGVPVQQFSEPKITTNIITPNGDGKNDDVGVNMEGETPFQFTIMDARGQTVFQTNDKSKHWNGQDQHTGQECKAGNYYYTIIYILNQNSPPKRKTGSINLSRPEN